MSSDDADHRVLTAVLVVGVVALVAGGVGFVLGMPPWGCANGGQSSPPPTTVGFEQSGPSGNVTVTVTHDGGDALPAGRVLVRAGGQNRTWAERAGTAPGTDVVAGDSLRVTGLAAGETIVVRYDFERQVDRRCGDPGLLGRYAVRNA